MLIGSRWFAPLTTMIRTPTLRKQLHFNYCYCLRKMTFHQIHEIATYLLAFVIFSNANRKSPHIVYISMCVGRCSLTPLFHVKYVWQSTSYASSERPKKHHPSQCRKKSLAIIKCTILLFRKQALTLIYIDRSDRQADGQIGNLHVFNTIELKLVFFTI